MPNGSNVSYTNPGTVRFFYDHRTHYVTSDAQGPLITAPGTWNSELGCATDKAQACLRPWLQDPDGDNTFTWATSLLPVGTYTFKVAENFATDIELVPDRRRQRRVGDGAVGGAGGTGDL